MPWRIRHTGILCILFCALSVQVLAQRNRDVMFMHFMVNTQAINPAYAGSREAMTFTVLNRSQWAMQFRKPPRLSSFSMHTPSNSAPVGMGLSFHNDRVGPEQITTVDGDVSYTVKTSHYTTLSFGIKGGVSMFYVPLTTLIIDDPTDPLFQADIESHWLPNFGFGMYFRAEHFYAGISIPKLLRVNPFQNRLYAGARPALTERDYYFITGGAIPVNIDIDIIPTVIARYRIGGEFLAGFSTNVMFYDKFLLGAGYRYKEAVGAMVGITVHDNLNVSYSFDWGIRDPAQNYNSGTHEVMIRYDLIFMDSHRQRAKRPF